MIRTATILLLVLIISSCENKKVVKTWKFPTYEEDTLALIRDIARDSTVDTSPIGFMGEDTTGQFIRYGILKRFASEQFLLLLTDHQSPAVRAYAYLILTDRNCTRIPDVIDKYKNDASIIRLRGGCYEMTVSINSLVDLAYQKNNSDKRAIQ
jgi:hypothetical protein